MLEKLENYAWKMTRAGQSACVCATSVDIIKIFNVGCLPVGRSVLKDIFPRSQKRSETEG